MKEAIRDYHIFLPRMWMKWCVYFLYPLCIVAGAYAMCHYLMFFWYVCAGFGCGVIAVVEIMLDTYVFRGIAARDTNRLEYLKTSIKGLPVLRKALAFDGVRRILSLLIILLGVCAVTAIDAGVDNSISMVKIILCVEIVFALIEFFFWITRMTVNVWVNLAVCYLLNGIAGVGTIFVLGSNHIRIWMVVLAAAVDIGVAVVGRGMIMKRARESYYDERSKKCDKAGEVWE